MDPSEIGDNLIPLGDITNTTNKVIFDRNERKRQKDKERYAAMSREQKDELNRKARERRAEKKRCDQESKHGEVGTRCMDENAPNETHEQGSDGQLKGGHIIMKVTNETCGEVSPTSGLYEINGTEGLHTIYSQAENETIIQHATHNPGDGQLNFSNIRIEDNGAPHPVIPDLHRGTTHIGH